MFQLNFCRFFTFEFKEKWVYRHKYTQNNKKLLVKSKRKTPIYTPNFFV